MTWIDGALLVPELPDSEQIEKLSKDTLRTMITAATTVVASKDQVSCDLAGEAVILNLKNSVYYGLDPVGARIWNQIQRPTSVAAIREAILQEYDVDAERCERDLLDLLQKLANQGLVEINNEMAV